MDNIGKKITKVVSIAIIIPVFIYFSILTGTLAHELMHKHYSYDTSVIRINYDASGSTTGSFYRHGHEWVYFNGWIVEGCIMFILMLCLFILIKK